MTAFILPTPLTRVPAGPNVLRRPHTLSFGPRMAMRSDSLAPVISVKDTHTDQTSKIGLTMAPIATDEAAAAALIAKAALTATLARKGRSVGQKEKIWKGTSGGESENVRAVVERCFPAAYRGMAPVVTLENGVGVGVRWERIEKVVGGVKSGDEGGKVLDGGTAGATKSVPFWKKPKLKWVQMSNNAGQSAGQRNNVPEVIETAKFEKHFPTRIRNRAPFIRLRAPQSEQDKTAYLEFGSEFVGLDEGLARRLQIPKNDQNAPNVSAAATVARYFGGNKANRAPFIEIEKDRSVVIEMKETPSPTNDAVSLATQYQSSNDVVDKNYPTSTRNQAPDISISKEDNKVELSVGFVDEPRAEAEDLQKERRT